MAPILCVVDAQKGFWQNVGKVRKELTQVLVRAVHTRQRVVVLELKREKFGPTHRSLMRILGGLPSGRLCVKEKWLNDGSEQFLDALREMRWDLGEGVEICGVNLCYCVKETAISLAELTTVELLRHASACWDHCDCNDDDGNILCRYICEGVAVNNNGTVQLPRHMSCAL